MTVVIVKFTAADTEREVKPLGVLMHASATCCPMQSKMAKTSGAAE
jgi:hypothetical protein